MDVWALLQLVVLLACIVVPFAGFFGIFWVARRKFLGRRTRFDRLFNGMARAQAQASHLDLMYPDPDERAVPLPPPPGGYPRERHRGRSKAP